MFYRISGYQTRCVVQVGQFLDGHRFVNGGHVDEITPMQGGVAVSAGADASADDTSCYLPAGWLNYRSAVSNYLPKNFLIFCLSISNLAQYFQPHFLPQ